MSKTGDFELDTSRPAVLRLGGVLSFDNSAAVLQAIHSALATGDVTQLDLAEVRHCDSAGLACVVAVAAEAGLRGRGLQVSGMPSGMRALAKVCEVERLLLG